MILVVRQELTILVASTAILPVEPLLYSVIVLGDPRLSFSSSLHKGGPAMLVTYLVIFGNVLLSIRTQSNFSIDGYILFRQGI